MPSESTCYDSIYFHRHYIVKRALGPARNYLCEHCLLRRVLKPARDWSTIHGHSGFDPYHDYVPLCSFCHHHYDNSFGYRPGERNPSAKLTENDVIEILVLLSKGCYQTKIAAIYDVSPSLISQINSGKKWSYLRKEMS